MAKAMDRRAGLSATLLLAPLVLFLGCVFFFPLYRLLELSLSSEAGMFASYAEIAESEPYRDIFVKTIILSASVALIATLLAYPTAYMLTRLKGWKLSLGVWCLLFPLWISVLVRTFSWILLLERNGPVNTALTSTGITDGPLSLLFNDFSVHLGMVHVLMPYVLLPIYTTMRAVDERLPLASDSLGASPMTTFLRVYLPLTLSGAATGFVLVFLLGLGFYITPAMLGGPQNATVSMLIDIFVNEQLDWSLAAAASFWLLIIITLLMLVAGRFVKLGGTLAAR